MTNLDSVPAASPVAASPLGAVAAQLVDHLSLEVTEMRQLEHRLDDGDLDDVEIRLVLGQLFANAMNALAVARGFHSSIVRLEAVGPVTAPALLDGDNVVSVMSGWLDDMQQASTLVAADLEAIDALAARLGDGVDVNDDDGNPATAAVGLIRALAQNAVGRLDQSHPPRPAPTG